MVLIDSERTLLIFDSRIIRCLEALLIKGVTKYEISEYPITRHIIKTKAVICAKLKIAIKINIEMKRPLTICNIGLIIFSETLVMFKRILEDRFELLSVRKYSYS